MSIDQVRITQLDFNGTATARCRLWDNSASAYDNNDAAMLLTDGSYFELWGQAADILYVGASAVFSYLGFRLKTAGSYAGMVFKYSITSVDYNITAVNQVTPSFSVATDLSAKFKDGYVFTVSGSTGNDGTYTCDGDSVFGAATVIKVVEAIPSAVADGKINAHSIWAPLTLVQASTNTFAASGFAAWVIPGDWGLSTVNSVSAYWVRGTVTAVTTAAEAYNLLRNVTLNAPLHKTMGSDIAEIECTQVACNMANVQLIQDWAHYGNRLYVEDLAKTTPIGTGSFATDAYYQQFKGRIAGPHIGRDINGLTYVRDVPHVTPLAVVGNIESPSKMQPQTWKLNIMVDAVETISTRLGLSA